MAVRKNFISILITNFNKEQYIYKSLKSVSSQQKFKNYEIILFDDISSDQSVRIIKKFNKVKLLKNKIGKKKFPALNQINGIFEAFKKSRGHIICLMDSDDVFKKNKLFLIDEFFKNNPSKNFVVNYPKTNFYIKLTRTKVQNDKWPSIFPTSCISIRRSFFLTFMKFSRKNFFPNLEIDARMAIFAYHYLNDFNILKKKLTIYFKDNEGISSRYKKFNKMWWSKRYEAFEYLKYILNIKNKEFKKGLDYFTTRIIHFFG